VGSAPLAGAARGELGEEARPTRDHHVPHHDPAPRRRHREPRSPLEDDFAAFAKRHGLPAPRINVRVNGKEVDALFPEERVIVELDSVEFHDDPISWRNDRRRDRNSAAHGYLTVRLIKEDLTDEDARELHQTLAQRRP
jgi:very-short-patch-repair endonuclease